MWSAISQVGIGVPSLINLVGALSTAFAALRFHCRTMCDLRCSRFLRGDECGPKHLLVPFCFLRVRGTGVFPLEKASAALECAKRKGALKVQIVCSQPAGGGENEE